MFYEFLHPPLTYEIMVSVGYTASPIAAWIRKSSRRFDCVALVFFRAKIVRSGNVILMPARRIIYRWQVLGALLTLRRQSCRVNEGTWATIQSQHPGKMVFFLLQVVLGAGDGLCLVVRTGT